MMVRVMKLFKSKDFLIKGFTNYFGSLLSGILIGTSYIPFLPWALFFCMVPLWLECLRHREGFWKTFFRGWITVFTVINRFLLDCFCQPRIRLYALGSRTGRAL